MVATVARRVTTVAAMAVILGFVAVSVPSPTVARAEDGERVVGHMLPFAREKLSKPIKLGCGVTVVEWRGGARDRAKLEALCLLATKNLDDYLAHVGVAKPRSNQKFKWSMALLPWGDCYRCLNDLRYRFRGRTARYPVTGYTSFHFRHTFVMGDTTHENFDVTVAHELWHAMSGHFGIFNRHPGKEWQRLRRDEELAVGFTKWLGLGR